MNIFTKTFTNLKIQKKLAFMPFVVAGFPNYKASLNAALHLAKVSDLLEVGFPFSDPVADGPTIQNADKLALKNGMTTKLVFKFVAEIKKKSKIPVTILVYANLVYQQGIESFYNQAKLAGINGVLVPDLPPEEAGPFVRAAIKAGVTPIFLAAQTTNNKRLKKILKYAQGYLYVVSILGVTGARKSFAGATNKMVKRFKSQTKMPLSIGFGISNKAQVGLLKQAGADGIIVGSAVLKIIEACKKSSELTKKLELFKNKLMP